MDSGRTTELQILVDRLRAGDEAARQELISRAYPRLYRLAAKMLGESFPRLRKPPYGQTNSDVAQEGALRLERALREVWPDTVLDFLRLAAHRMRCVLLDLAKKPCLPLDQRDIPPEDQGIPWPERPTDSGTSPRSEIQIRLHEESEKLPPKEREVVDLLFYHELTEAEAAALLNVSTKTVQRRWVSARRKLAEGLREP